MKSNTTIPLARAKSRVFPLVAAIVLAGLASTASAQQQARPAARAGRAGARPPRTTISARSKSTSSARPRRAVRPAARKSTSTNAGCATTSWRRAARPSSSACSSARRWSAAIRSTTTPSRTRSSTAAPTCRPTSTSSNEADLADLMSWLHDEKCCWNSDAPPLNPRYKGATAPARDDALRIADRRAEGPRQECPRRADRRHHGAADRGRDRDPHHRLQPRRRALRIPQGRGRLLYAAHRQADASSIRSPRPRWRSRAPKRSTTSRCCA